MPDVGQSVQIEQIGYSKPTNEGATFTITYILSEGWHGTGNNKFKIQVSITKDAYVVTKIITITAKST